MGMCVSFGSTACALYAPTSHMRNMSILDGAIDWCEAATAQDTKYREACEFGVGYRAYKTNPGDMAVVERACRANERCIRSAVHTHQFMFPLEAFELQWCQAIANAAARAACRSA